MKWLIGLMTLLSATFAFAQPIPDTLWTRTYGGSGQEGAYSLDQTADGGYIIAGCTNSFGAGGKDLYLIKTDNLGDTLWTRTFGGTGEDEARSVQQTSDGGYIVAGYICTLGSQPDFYIVKTNSLGNSQWTRRFGGPESERAYSVQQTFDGGYIIAGIWGTGWWARSYLIKTNSSGDTLWTRMYAGFSDEPSISVQETSDFGYIIAGSTQTFGAGYEDFYLVKTNYIGNVLWTRTYGGPHDDEAFSVQQTSDNGYIIAGSTSSYGAGNNDFYLVKTNSLGDPVWTRTFGGADDDRGYSVQQTSDGGFIVAGYTTYFSYLVKTDLMGDTLWTRTLGGDYTRAYSIQQISDGGYIVAGGQSEDLYVVRLASERAVHVHSPNGGEDWRILDSATIRWFGYGFNGNVKIELNRYYPSGNWEILAGNTENDGEESFLVTEPLSDSCRVRISTLLDTLTDVSDRDFAIISSQGYLALVRLSQAQVPMITWNAGLVECPNSVTQVFNLKNFGSESIIVYPPALYNGQHFSLESNCSTLNLAPGQVSACSLTVTYDPLSDGIHYDTLLIMTDAVNQQGGYVRIPLQGQRISTPAAPVTVLSLEGNNARLTWEPITESILGCPVTPTAYLIFYSETYAGSYYFLNCTPDTTYLHTWVVRFAPSMFYDVVAITEPLSRLDFINGNVNYTREEVLGKLRIRN